MKKLPTHIKKYWLLVLAIMLQLLFYVSASWTHWLDIFFPGGSLHDGLQGIDFYQIPRGAWAFWHGGSLTGAPLANGMFYGPHHYVSSNVYHPIVTLLLGSVLMLFSWPASFYVCGCS